MKTCQFIIGRPHSSSSKKIFHKYYPEILFSVIPQDLALGSFTKKKSMIISVTNEIAEESASIEKTDNCCTA